jgi:hypothetical protein
MNNLNKTTKFSVTSYDRTTTVEVDHCDVDMGEFLDIVKVLAIGMTFHEDTFKRGIIELAAQYEEEMREEDVYRPDPTLEKEVNDYFRNLSDKELDEAFAEHNADEEADWDVTLNDGLEDDDWTEELEKQYWKEQCPEPFATPEEIERDGEFNDYGERVKGVEKKTKKDAKRK